MVAAVGAICPVARVIANFAQLITATAWIMTSLKGNLVSILWEARLLQGPHLTVFSHKIDRFGPVIETIVCENLSQMAPHCPNVGVPRTCGEDHRLE